MGPSDSSDESEQPRAGLGSKPPPSNPPTHSPHQPSSYLLESSGDEAPKSSSDDEEALGQISGLPSTFGGSRSRKRRRVSNPSNKPTAASTQASKSIAEARPPGDWERHTRGIGSKLMAKYGFKGRLGKHGDGIAAPIEVKLRTGKAGIGAGEADKSADIAREKESEARAGAVKSVMKGGWKLPSELKVAKLGAVDGGVATTARLHVTPDVPREAKIVDMRGGNAREVSSIASALNDGAEDGVEHSEDGFPQPEIVFKLRLLVDADRINRDAFVRRRETEKLIIETTRAELLRLDKEQERLKAAVEETSKLKSAIQKAKGLSAEVSTAISEEWFETFAKMVLKNAPVTSPDKYSVRAALEEILRVHVDSKLSELLSKKRPERRASLSLARHMTRCLKFGKSALPEECFIRLSTQMFLKRLRRHIGSPDWEVVSGARLADILLEMKDVIPEAISITLGEEVVGPKLSKRLDEMDSKGDDEIPMHVWIHPWLPIVGRRPLTEVFGRVRMRLSRLLESWTVEQESDRMIKVVKSWSSVLSRRKVQLLLARHIVPKVGGDLKEYCARGDMMKDSRPKVFTTFEEWCEVLSSRMVCTGIEDDVFGTLCKRVQKDVMMLDGIEGWKIGKEWYEKLKRWMPRKLDLGLQGGYAGLLFMLHACRVSGRNRRELAVADCTVLLRNRFGREEGERSQRDR